MLGIFPMKLPFKNGIMISKTIGFRGTNLFSDTPICNWSRILLHVITHEKWWFSIATLNYQRVNLLLVNLPTAKNNKKKHWASQGRTARSSGAAPRRAGAAAVGPGPMKHGGMVWMSMGFTTINGLRIHRIHGAGIYANIGGILMVNVTIYIAYMDPMGRIHGAGIFTY